ncbi:MAG: tetratricopeptide repeat protein [Candidatus Aminicenantia bacterium]
MRVRIIIALIFIFMVIIIGFLILKSKKSSVSIEEKEEIPIDISLRYIQGVDGHSSLIILHLFSRQMLQKEIDNKILHREEEIKPLVISYPENFWKENVVFLVSEKGGSEYRKLERGVQLVKAPEETRLTIAPGKLYEAVYKVLPTVTLQPGDRLRAEMILHRQIVRSDEVEIPTPPTGKKEKLIQKAKIFAHSGENEKLLSTAEELISFAPNDPSGYWFKGMALENKEDYKSAISVYEQALKKYQKLAPGEHFEPPMLLVEKIRVLKKKFK